MDITPSNTSNSRRKRRTSKETSSTPGISPKLTIESSNNNDKKRKEVTLDPVYWRDEGDAITIQYQEISALLNQSDIADHRWSDWVPHPNEIHSMKKRIQFKVHGNPLPLRRHRTAHGFMYNPSSAAQRIFREVVTSMLPSYLIPFEETMHDHLLNHTHMNLMSPDTSSPTIIIPPLFQENEHLSVQIIFYMKRPKTHFVANNPQSGRIRKLYEGFLPHRSKTDVDNLAKFVLDSLNGLLYADDKQVISLHVTKLLHSEGDFKGMTQICMESMHESHVKSLLEQYYTHSFDQQQ